MCAYTHKKYSINDGTYKQQGAIIQLYVNSNQCTCKPPMNARTYTGIFSHKQMYAQINAWACLYANERANRRTDTYIKKNKKKKK